jgi:hypothetical protein
VGAEAYDPSIPATSLTLASSEGMGEALVAKALVTLKAVHQDRIKPVKVG